MMLFRLIFITLLFICAYGLLAQGSGGAQKNRRNQYKTFKGLSVQNQGDSIRHSLAMRHWIVEIDRIPGRRGTSIPIEVGRFFIAVNGDTAFVCVDQGSSSEECSAVIRAVVERYVVLIDRSQAIYAIDMTVEEQSRSFSIKVEVNPSCSVAWVNISGKRMRKAVFVGHIVPLIYSPVYRASVDL